MPRNDTKQYQIMDLLRKIKCTQKRRHDCSFFKIHLRKQKRKKIPNHTAILLPSSRGRRAINFLNALRSVDLMTCIWTTLVTKTQRPWQLAEKENRTNFKFIRIYFNSSNPKDARKSSEEIGGGRFGSRDTQGSETCLCSLSGEYI